MKTKRKETKFNFMSGGWKIKFMKDKRLKDIIQKDKRYKDIIQKDKRYKDII